MRKLIGPFKASTESLEDLLLIMANAVESAMIQAGAQAGKDYSYHDLFELGAPFALAMFTKKENNVTFNTEEYGDSPGEKN